MSLLTRSEELRDAEPWCEKLTQHETRDAARSQYHTHYLLRILFQSCEGIFWARVSRYGHLTCASDKPVPAPGPGRDSLSLLSLPDDPARRYLTPGSAQFSQSAQISLLRRKRQKSPWRRHGRRLILRPCRDFGWKARLAALSDLTAVGNSS